ncbi:hypothetical protein [Adonisia turfae]|uniref:hypothetical protein n=1 Tax=Adonisia turfae TaxID=2950184 RepID=UPI002029B19A|nr:hypothetical protein [Adonisia turfae]
MGQQGFWDVETRHQKLESKKDLLICLDEMIPWDEFREMLESVYAQPRKRKAGRPRIDVIVMFKLLILQQLYRALGNNLTISDLNCLTLKRQSGSNVITHC